MNVYLAGQYVRAIDIDCRGTDLERACLLDDRWSIKVCSQWHTAPKVMEALDGERGIQASAIMDLDDLDMADAIVLFTDMEPTDPEGWRGAASGGRHFEFGYARAQAKRLYLVGPRTNAFHHLPGVRHFHKWDPVEMARCLRIDWTWIMHSKIGGAPMCYQCGAEFSGGNDRAIAMHLTQEPACRIDPPTMSTPGPNLYG